MTMWCVRQFWHTTPCSLEHLWTVGCIGCYGGAAAAAVAATHRHRRRYIGCLWLFHHNARTEHLNRGLILPSFFSHRSPSNTWMFCVVVVIAVVVVVCKVDVRVRYGGPVCYMRSVRCRTKRERKKSRYVHTLNQRYSMLFGFSANVAIHYIVYSRLPPYTLHTNNPHVHGVCIACSSMKQLLDREPNTNILSFVFVVCDFDSARYIHMLAVDFCWSMWSVFVEKLAWKSPNNFHRFSTAAFMHWIFCQWWCTFSIKWNSVCRCCCCCHLLLLVLLEAIFSNQHLHTKTIIHETTLCSVKMNSNPIYLRKLRTMPILRAISKSSCDQKRKKISKQEMRKENTFCCCCCCIYKWKYPYFQFQKSHYHK